MNDAHYILIGEKIIGNYYNYKVTTTNCDYNLPTPNIILSI